MRWAAGVEYLGTSLSGWQLQSGGPASVQSVLEEALSTVADHVVATTAAGRTDAGVHAFGQVIHFDSDAARRPYAWLLGTNTRLHPQVSLRWIQPVQDEFNARHSARRRYYRYVIHNERARSALLRGRTGWVPRPLADADMHAAVQALVGEHDFSAFRAAECQAPTPVRTVESARVWRSEQLVVLDICANAFLHHMVRNIVGVLIEIGMQARAVGWAQEVLDSRDRRCAGMTAPADGLYFVGPQYPAQFALPAPARPWFPS